MSACLLDNADLVRMILCVFPDANARTTSSFARDPPLLVAARRGIYNGCGAFSVLLERLPPSRVGLDNRLILSLFNLCVGFKLATRRAPCDVVDKLLAYMARHDLAHGKELEEGGTLNLCPVMLLMCQFEAAGALASLLRFTAGTRSPDLQDMRKHCARAVVRTADKRGWGEAWTALWRRNGAPYEPLSDWITPELEALARKTLENIGKHWA